MSRTDFAEGHVFVGTTVSEVWGRALLSLSEKGTRAERSPLLFVVEGDLDAIEISPIREALDTHLATDDQTSVEEVAWTVFPHSIWRIHGPKGRTAFFDAYRRGLPWFVQGSKKARKSNRRGIYFARMVGFDLDPATGKPTIGGLPDEGNQLETVLRLYERSQEVRDGRRKGVQRIKLQVGIFDPVRDHTPSPYLPFPCLQHVTFEPDVKSGVLHTSAFYATQQLVRKAYGNLLGLHQLGTFMATEMKLRPGRLSVFVGVEKLGVAPARTASLVAAVESVLDGVVA